MQGSIIVGQSGGPTAVINSSLAGVVKTAKDRGAKKIYGMLHGIQGFLDEESIRKAEKMANEIIQENIEVEFLTPSKKELKKLKLRRDLPNTDEQIRIVKIGDLDINACCGVNASKTLDLQIIKIRR